MTRRNAVSGEMMLGSRRLAVALFLAVAALATAAPALGQDYHREELRVPFAGSPRGLEAVLIRPSGEKRYPLALISHGAPRDAAERRKMSPNGYYRQAVEFARRGFAALVVMRRGYGDSEPGYAEDSGRCGARDYLRSARSSAADLKAAIEAMRKRSDVTLEGMIALGQSAGGLATVALAAEAPPELKAAINFAGGRGSRADRDVCDEDRLVATFGAFGRTARVPMLWVYSENDQYFWPELAQRFHAAFTAAGGRAEFIAAPKLGEDGHVFFARAIEQWTPMVDRFLAANSLARDVLPPPQPAQLAAPPRISPAGREGFTAYLKSGPHRAFAVSPKGAWSWRSGARDAASARAAALEACNKSSAAECRIYATDDALEPAQ